MDFNENETPAEIGVPDGQQSTVPSNTDSGDFPPQNGGVLAKPVFEDRKYYIGITALFVALAVLLTFVITYVIVSISFDRELEKIEAEYREELDYIGEFRTIIELYNALPEEQRNIETYKKLAYIDYYYRTNYVGKIDEEQLVYMVANGYVMGMEDMFGGYYTADEFKTVIGDVEGNTVGIGVYVTADLETDGIRISHVMEGGPAYEAGLLPKDVITHVDGKSVTELGYYTAIDLIKGEEGTEVKLVILRNGEYYEKTLTRKTVNVESVIYKKHASQDGVGIIRIVEFNNATYAQFKAAIETAIKKDKCKSLVFDLRGNPGGTLTSVVDMLDFMLPEGVIVTQRYAGGEKEEYLSDNEGDEFEALYGKDIKMAVLVNGGTASAAELFTCAMKDYEKAIVVGEKTYGKGCGQNVVPLYDGSGLVFTTFMYDPPKSENYNGVGIAPHIKAELSEEASKMNIFELEHDKDDQLKAAVEALK